MRLKYQPLFWLLVLSILPYLLLSFFVHPIADDYTSAIGTQTQGFWNSQVIGYETWSGRYFATFLLALVPIAWNNFLLYKLASLFVIIWVYFGFLESTKILCSRLKATEQIFIATLVFSLFLNNLISSSQALYWYTGAMTYLFPLPIALISIAILLTRTIRTRALIFLTVSSFIMIGSNETLMLLWDLFLLSVFIAEQIKTKKINVYILVIGILSFVFSLAVALAPGNSVRLENYDHIGLASALAGSTLTGLQILLLSIKPATIAVLLIAIPWLLKNSDRISAKLRTRKALAITFVSLIAESTLTLFPGYFSMGHLPPLRVLNPSMVFHDILFILLIFQLIALLPARFQNRISSLNQYPLITSTIFAIALFSSGNHQHALTDLALRAPAYDQQMKYRYSYIAQHPDDKNLTVPKIIDPPTTIVADEISSDPTFWLNASYAKFFGLDSIRTTNQ